MSLGPDFQLIDLTVSDWENELRRYQSVIIEDKFLDAMDTSGFEISQASVNWDSKTIPILMMNYGKSEFDSLFNETGRKYYFLTRK